MVNKNPAIAANAAPPPIWIDPPIPLAVPATAGRMESIPAVELANVSPLPIPIKIQNPKKVIAVPKPSKDITRDIPMPKIWNKVPNKIILSIPTLIEKRAVAKFPKKKPRAGRPNKKPIVVGAKLKTFEPTNGAPPKKAKNVPVENAAAKHTPKNDATRIILGILLSVRADSYF